MPWCDGHLDLAFLAVNGRNLRRRASDLNAGCVTLPALRDGGVRWIFGTIFTEIGLDGEDQAHRYADHGDRDGAFRAGMRQLECYEHLEREGDIGIVRCACDLDEAPVVSPKVIVLMEGADPIRCPEELGVWRSRGLRIVGLAWAAGSRYAGGNGPPPGQPIDGRYFTGGLTSEGRELVRAIDEEGLIHDVSHLSDEAFDDMMACVEAPVIATHSNCRALMGAWQRHLRDDQILAISRRSGVIGLNLFGKFLAHDRRATIEDCIAHVEHVVEVADRRDVVALGSDMDGGFGPSQLPKGLDHPTKLDALAEALHSRGWSDSEIGGFTHLNWLRVLRSALP